MAGSGWRDMLSDQVAVKAARARQQNSAVSDTFRISRVAFSALAHPFLVRAAHARGISLSGYIRRATMAFVARDLGLDRRGLFSLDAGARPADMGRPVKDLDEKVYGSWEI